MNYIDIINENKRLGAELSGTDNYPIAVLSNITVNQIKEILEYKLRLQGVNANIVIGNYDNIVQESHAFNNYKLVVIFWEAINLIDGLQYKCELMSKDEMNELIDKVKSEIDYVIDNLKSVPAVIINKFTPMVFNAYNLVVNNLDYICNELNEYLKNKDTVNLNIVNIEKILARISIDRSTDLRYYYTSKALYTINFYKEYSEFILPIPLSLNGKSKKALIFDCDNTLWKGILGEDGYDNIVMSSNQNGGIPYEEVQSLSLSLENKGVLLGLCSKNNERDVNDVFNNHPHTTLRNDDLTIKMVNWSDKVSNLKTIGERLNIGMDSFVFIDDSDFEIGLVNTHLPMIHTVQVPKSIYRYPVEVRKAMNMFYSPSLSTEDAKRIEMYKEQLMRDEMKQKYHSVDEYLKALQMNITLYRNIDELIPRISQMTQKTNQFNLTTKRYSENEIKCFINDPGVDVLAISVNDKYGDNGVTGLAIIKYQNDCAYIDTFLLSCRVIGRNIEYVLFDEVIKYCINNNIKRIIGEYGKTLKNDQVSDFYDKLNFKILENKDMYTKYELMMNDYKNSNIDYIAVNYGK